jgi:hypothetical protein
LRQAGRIQAGDEDFSSARSIECESAWLPETADPENWCEAIQIFLKDHAECEPAVYSIIPARADHLESD